MPLDYNSDGDFGFTTRNVNNILKIAKKQIKHGMAVPSDALTSEMVIIVMYCKYLFEVRFIRDLVTDELYSEIRPINQITVNGDFHVKIGMNGHAEIIDANAHPNKEDE